MDHDEERSLSLGTELSASVPPPSPLTGCYLLAVIGEPHTNEHKEIILQRLVKGLLSWDSNEHQVDLEKELSTLTAQAPEGEEARYGERLIQFASENLVTEILIHPQMNTLMQCMRNLLSSFTRHRHLVHAGYTFAGNGSWIMQDGTFSLADFTDAYQENEVQRVIRAYENSISIDIHCSTSGGGEWHKLPDMPFVKHCKIRVNPTDILDSGSQAIKDFVGYLEPYIVPASLEQLLVSSEVVGNIRFSHPTLYVFPGGQGDAALFGINGFNMLVDGGFSRKACWWDFARHLDRLDAVLFTRLNNCSVSGMAAVLHRKATTPVYPQIGHFFCNLEERRALASPDGDKDSDPLLVSLLQQGSDMMADLRHLNLKPQYCYRSPDPINLYHKVGHGTLDMYVLNPSKDSKYVREFLKRWHNSEQKLFEGSSVSGQFNFPIPNLVSICALLVWRPANPDDTVTRIMFPGSTPQHKIFEGLEKLKHLEFLQTPTCTGRQMTASATPPPAPVISTKTTKSTTRISKEKSTVTQEKTKEEKIIEPELQAKKELKDIIKDGTDSKNIIDNKLLSELVDGEEKKIESVLHEAITARVESTLDDKIAQYESTVIDGLPKKKEIKKKIVEKRTKKAEKTEDTTDSVAKSTDSKKETEIKVSEPKARIDIRKRVENRSKTESMSSSGNRTKISNRSTQKGVERKIVSNTVDKKAISEDKRSPPTTPKKTLESKTTSQSVPSMAKDRVKAKTRKLSPGSTPAKSTKEAANRRVAESKYKQSSPKRDISQKPIEKKEPKPKREPISRRPRPLASPVKGLKPTKSPSKAIKSIKTDAKLKGLQRVNYEDILKEAKKSDEDTSKSLDDIKQQELDEKEEQEIVREIEAVFNRDSEAEERIEYVGRSDIEKITCILDNAKTEATADGEFEEEYLIIEKEEVDQYTEDSIIDHGSSQDREDELQKHVKDKAESEKKKVDGSEQNIEITKETKEHSLSVEEKQDSSEKKTSDSKSKDKPKDSLELNMVQESQPDEKISTTVESGATTAPTLPEDERITLDDIKEDQQVEEKHVREETKETIPPQTLMDIVKPASIDKSPKLDTQPPAPIREIVKTPDEVADLPLHEEVDYRTYEEKKTPIEEDIFKRKPDVGFVHEIKVPKDLPIPDQDAMSYKGIKTIQDDVIIKTIERPSHAELVTVTPGSAPESPMSQEPKNITSLSNKDLDPVKEYDNGDFNYTQYTEKLRETHITTLDSPIKEDIVVIDEVPCMPEKIPSIPEDVEREIEEAHKLETVDRPPISPKEVERIVADVAEVLKSEKSLDELIAKSPTLLRKSPEIFTNLDSTTSSAIVSSEMHIQASEKKEIDHKLETKTTEEPMKEVSPARSITSEDVSESSDKTVLSEEKRTKREVNEKKIISVDNTLKKTDILDVIVDEKIANYDIIDKEIDAAPNVTAEVGERKLSISSDTAKTLEKLEEKMADLKRKEEAFSQRLLHDRKLSSTCDKKDISPEEDEQTHEKLKVKNEEDLTHKKDTELTDGTVDIKQANDVFHTVPDYESSMDGRTQTDVTSTEFSTKQIKSQDSAIEIKLPETLGKFKKVELEPLEVKEITEISTTSTSKSEVESKVEAISDKRDKNEVSPKKDVHREEEVVKISSTESAKQTKSKEESSSFVGKFIGKVDEKLNVAKDFFSETFNNKEKPKEIKDITEEKRVSPFSDKSESPVGRDVVTVEDKSTAKLAQVKQSSSERTPSPDKINTGLIKKNEVYKESESLEKDSEMGVGSVTQDLPSLRDDLKSAEERKTSTTSVNLCKETSTFITDQAETSDERKVSLPNEEELTQAESKTSDMDGVSLETEEKSDITPTVISEKEEDNKSIDAMELQKKALIDERSLHDTTDIQPAPMDIGSEFLSSEKHDVKKLSPELLKKLDTSKEKLDISVEDDASKSQFKQEQIDIKYDSHSRPDTKASMPLTLNLDLQDEDLEEYMSSPPLTADTVKADDLSVSASPFEKLAPRTPSSVVDSKYYDEQKTSPAKEEYSETKITVKLEKEFLQQEDICKKSSPKPDDMLFSSKQIADKSPSLIKQSDDESPTPIIPQDEAQSPLKSIYELDKVDDKASASLGLDKEITSDIKQDKLPSPVKTVQENESLVKSKEKPTVIECSEVTSSRKLDEPAATEPSDKKPSQIQKKDTQQSTLKLENVEISSTEINDKSPSPAKMNEINSSVKETVITSEKISPSSVQPEDEQLGKNEVLSSISVCAALPSPTIQGKENLSEKHRTILSDDMSPSSDQQKLKQKGLIKLKDDDLSEAEFDAQALSSSKIDEKIDEQTYIKANDKEFPNDATTLSPIKTDETKSSIKDNVISCDEKSPNPVQNKLDVSCVMEVKGEDLKLETEAPSPTKVDVRILSTTETVTSCDDKSPSPVPKELDEKSPVKENDDELSLFQKDAKTPSPTKVDETKPIRETVTPSDDKSPSPVQKELDQSAIIINDDEASSIQHDVKSPIPTNVDERKLSTTEAGISSDDKPPQPIQKDLEEHSPTKIHENELGTIQEDSKILTPTKVDEIKTSVQETVTPSDVKLPSPVQKELDHSVININETDASSIQKNIKSPIPTNVDERKLSTTKAVISLEDKLLQAVQKELEEQSPTKADENDLGTIQEDAKTRTATKVDVISSEDKSPSPVQKELDQSAINKNDIEASSIEKDGKSHSPTIVDERKLSTIETVISSEEKSPKSVQKELEEQSLTKMDESEIGTIQEDAKMLSTTEVNERKESIQETVTPPDDKIPSQVKKELADQNAIKENDKEVILIQKDVETNNQIKADERKPSIKETVTPSNDKSPSPVQKEKDQSAINKNDIEASSIDKDGKSHSPTIVDERKLSTIEAVISFEDKSPESIQKELEEQSLTKVDVSEIGTIQENAKILTPTKVDERKSSIKEAVTPSDDKTPSSVQKELDEQSASKVNDNEIISIEKDVETPCQTKVDDRKLTIAEAVISSDDKSPSPFQKEVDQSVINKNDIEASSTQIDGKSPSPINVDERKLSTIEAVISSEDKSLESIQKELEEQSLTKVDESEIGKVQEDTTTLTPTKVDERKSSIKEAVTPSDDYSTSQAKKELADQSATKENDKEVISIQNHVETPSQTKADERKPSIRETVTPSDDKSLSLIQKELDQSVINKNDIEASSIEKDGKSSSPTKVDERKPSTTEAVISSKDKSPESVQKELEEQSLTKVDESEIGTIQDDAKILASTKMDERKGSIKEAVTPSDDYSPSQVKKELADQSATKENDKEVISIQNDTETPSHTKADERKPSIRETVTPSDDKSPSLIQKELDQSVINKNDIEASSIDKDGKSPSPTKVDERKLSTTEAVISSKDKSPESVQKELEEQSLTKVDESEIGTIQDDAKILASTKMDERKGSIKEAVTPSDDYSPSQVKKELADQSATKENDKEVISIQNDTETPSHTKADERKPSIRETVTPSDDKSPSLIQKELDQSVINKNDIEASSIDKDGKSPSPTKVDERKLSTTEAVISSKDKSPESVQKELEEQSLTKVDESEIGTIQDDAKILASTKMDERKGSIKEAVTPSDDYSPSQVKKELADQSATKENDKEVISIQNDAETPSHTKADERKPSIRETVTPSDDKSPSPFQKELDQSVIDKNEIEASSIEKDGKSPSPSNADERKLSTIEAVISSENKSPESVQKDLEEQSITKVDKNELGTIQENAKILILTKVDERKASIKETVTPSDVKLPSPVKKELDQSAISINDSEPTLIQKDPKSPSPTNVDERKLSTTEAVILLQDKLPQPVQIELEEHSPTLVNENKLGEIQKDAKTPTPTKVVERKPSIEESITHFDDKLPNLVQKELDQSAVDVNDKEVISIQKDTETPSQTNEDESKLRKVEAVISSEDKSPQSKRELKEQSSIKVDKSELETIQEKPKILTPTKVDERKASTKEAVTFSDSQNQVKKELDDSSPVKINDEDLSSIQKDAGIPSPKKEDKMKASIQETVTPSDDKSPSPVQKELDQTAINKDDNGAILFHTDAKSLSSTTVGEIKLSTTGAFIKSDHNSPQSVQKESEKQSPTKVDENEFSKIQEDAKIVTPTKVDERKESIKETVTLSDAKSPSLVQEELDQSAININDNEVSTIQNDAKNPSPTNVDERKLNTTEAVISLEEKLPRPVQKKIEEHSPTLVNENELGKIQEDAKNPTPTKVNERKPSIEETITLSDDKLPKLVQKELDQSTIDVNDKEVISIQKHVETLSQTKADERKPSLKETVTSPSDKSPSPVQKEIDKSAINKINIEASPIHKGGKSPSATNVDERKLSTTDAVISSEDKSPQPVEKELKQQSSTKVDKSLQGTIQEDAKVLATSKVDERKASIKETVTPSDVKSPSPVKKELYESSPLKINDNKLSPIQKDDKTPSQTEVDNIKLKIKETVTPSDDKSPSPVQNELHESAISKNDNEATTIQTDPKSPSPTNVDERKLSTTEAVISLEEKLPQPVQIELEEHSPTLVNENKRGESQKDAITPTPTKVDERKPSIKETITPSDDKLPNIVENELDQIDVSDKEVISIQKDTDTPSQTKIDDRKLSMAKAVSASEGKLSSPVPKELDEQSPTKVDDNELSSIEDDGKILTSTKVDERKPSIKETVTPSDDKSPSPVQKDLDRNAININDSEASSLLKNAESPSPPNVDERKLRTTEAVILLDDKLPQPVQKELEEYSPTQVHENELGEIQEDAKTPTPTKVDERKANIEETNTTSEDKSLNLVEKELDQSAINVHDDEAVSIQNDATCTPSLTKEDEIKLSTAAAVISSDDKLPSPVPKELDGQSPTKVNDNELNLIQEDSKIDTLTKVDESKASIKEIVILSGDMPPSPVQKELDQQNATKINDNEVILIQKVVETPSPTKADVEVVTSLSKKSPTLVKKELKELSSTNVNDEILSSVQEVAKTPSPTNADETKSSVNDNILLSEKKSPIQIQNEFIEQSAIKVTDVQISSMQESVKSTSLTTFDEKKHSTKVNVILSDDKSTGAVQLKLEEHSPVKMEDEDLCSDEVVTKTSSPKKGDERKQSLAETVISSDDKSPSLVQKDLDESCSVILNDEEFKVEVNIPSPPIVNEKKPSSKGTVITLDEKSPKPNQDDQSVIKADDVQNSLMQGSVKTPSPTKLDKRKSSIKDDVILSDNESSGLTQLNLEEHSIKRMKDKDLSSVEVGAKSQSPVKADEIKPSIAKTVISSDEKSQSFVRKEADESRYLKLKDDDFKVDAKTQSPTKVDERKESIKGTITPSDDKRPSSVQKELEEPSPTNVKDENISSVKADIKTPSPTKLDETKPSTAEIVSFSDENPTRLVQIESEEAIALNVEDISVVKVDAESSSPTKLDENNSIINDSVTLANKIGDQEELDKQSPLTLKDNEFSSIEESVKAPSPTKQDETKLNMKETLAEIKSQSTVQIELDSYPTKVKDEDLSSGQADLKVSGTLKLNESKSSIEEVVTLFDSKSPSSGRIESEEPSPTNVKDEDTSPVKEDTKNLSTTKVHEEKISKSEPQVKEHTVSPTKADQSKLGIAGIVTFSDYKSPSLVQKESEEPCSKNINDKDLSPDQADAKTPSPIKVDEVKPCTEEMVTSYDEKSLSPVHIILDKQSNGLSLIQEVLETSCPTETNERKPSVKENVISLDDKSPCSLDSQSEKHSPINVKDEELSLVFVDAKIPSPIKMDEMDETVISTAKSQSPIQNESEEHSLFKLNDNVNPSLTEQDETEPIIKETICLSNNKSPSDIQLQLEQHKPTKVEKESLSPAQTDAKISSSSSAEGTVVTSDDKIRIPVQTELIKPIPVKTNDERLSSIEVDDKTPSSPKQDGSKSSISGTANSIDDIPTISVQPKLDQHSPITLKDEDVSPVLVDVEKPSPMKVHENIFVTNETVDDIANKFPRLIQKQDEQQISFQNIEKKPITVKEIEITSKYDEKDVDEKEHVENMTHHKLMSLEESEKALNINAEGSDPTYATNFLSAEKARKSSQVEDVGEHKDKTNIEKEVNEDGESTSEDSQLDHKIPLKESEPKEDNDIKIVQEDLLLVPPTKISSEEKTNQEAKEFDEQLHKTLKSTVDISDKLSSISTVDSGIVDRDSILYTIAHGSSSEDVSKEVSLEEKYSFESPEKSNKKLTTKSISSHSKDEVLSAETSILSNVAHTNSAKASESVQKSTLSSQAGSPREEIPASETSDSGIHSIPTDINQAISNTNDETSSQTVKDSAAHLVESIHKAFEEESIQQGIKTEDVESLQVHSEYERVSTPPTVPVSPLPKTPNNFQDIKVTEGVQSEVSYDKSDDTEETITKVVHVGEDVLTQRISTLTEKVPKTLKSSDMGKNTTELTAIMQTVGKIKTETDTVTKIIKEGENVVTQTITTVTTKEVISREDGTPQNVKTTIETTTLSKGSDGTITSSTDTQTLLSECSSSLRSTSQLDMYCKDSKVDNLSNEASDDKTEIVYSDQGQDSRINKKVANEVFMADQEVSVTMSQLKPTFVTETDEDDDNIEDTVIDTDVSKRVIRENNTDIMETITTVTKKETLKIDESKKVIRTTTETNKTKEHPDGSKVVQKNVEIRTEDIVSGSSNNLDKILSEFTLSGDPEESVTTDTVEFEQDNVNIKRTISTKVITTKYADNLGIVKKVKKDTIVTTTDSYPDGSSRTKVDSSTSLSDIYPEDLIETFELTDLDVIENKKVEVEEEEIPAIVNGKSVIQLVTTTTTKETLTNKEKTKKKLKTTIETVTKTILPDGMTEITKDMKVTIADVMVEIPSEDEFQLAGNPKEETSTNIEFIKENEIEIKRKTTITTKIQEFHNLLQNIKRKKTTVKTVIEDEHPDKSVSTKISEKVSIVDENLASSSGIDKELDDVQEHLIGYNPVGEPRQNISSESQVILENGITVKRNTTVTTVVQEYFNELDKTKRIKTTVITLVEDMHPDGSIFTKTSEQVSITDEEVSEKTTEKKIDEQVVGNTDNKSNLIFSDNIDSESNIHHYPDGSSQTTVNTSTSDVEIEETRTNQDLIGYSKIEDKSVSVDTQEKTLVTDGQQVIQVTTTTTTKEILSSDYSEKKKLKTTIEIVKETKLPNGRSEITKDIKVSIADYDVACFDDSMEGYTKVGDKDIHTTTDTTSITENNVKIIRKTSITTIRQEYENELTKTRKIKTNVQTVVEDEHPDGTVITKKSEKILISDVFLQTPELPTKSQEADTIETYSDDNESVEDTVEESNVVNESFEKDSIKIKRTITTKTKRETLASPNKNIKRVRTTIETTTVDEYPDGSTETTKDVKITISEFQKTTDNNLQAALQGLEPSGKTKSSVDKKVQNITEKGENITQTITTYVTKEEFKNSKSNEIAVKTITETVTENAMPDGSSEITKDIRTQITYLPVGTDLDDWTPEELEETKKQPTNEEKPKFEELPLRLNNEVQPEIKTKIQRSPVGEMTTETDTFTKVVKDGDHEVNQTITVVTTKEVISPEKVKVTVETTTVSKGSDGIIKTSKSTKTTISECKEEYEEIIDTGESEKSSKHSSARTGDMRSSSAASDEMDHPGISSPPSEISSRGSKAAVHIWGTESSGIYYSDDDGQGSPSSTKSQVAHSPKSNLSFELDKREENHDILYEKHDQSSSMLENDPMSMSIYGQLPEEESCTSSTHSEVKSEIHITDKSMSKITEEFLSQEISQSQRKITSDATFLKEADEHFEKAIEEHKKVSGFDVISNITAKYELDQNTSTSRKVSSEEQGAITLQDIKSENKKMVEVTSSSSTSDHSTKTVKSEKKQTKDPIESWGKPLGLPSPTMPPTQDGKSTPKKTTTSSNILNKNKINQEKSKEAKSRASESPSKKKAPAPVYLELTYVPHHGNSYYSALEFFKRVRARYYVFSGTEPSKEIYNALLDAKKTWEDKDLEVTIIPTYDTDVLGYWVTENEDALEKYKIDLSPSASRCTINLQDHETSCAAYRLEF